MEKSRILIADDAELNREMLTQMLGKQYEFLYAGNGIEAIQMLGGERAVDLLLLDINMPEMGGFEVLQIMHERQWIKEIPVIVISADDNAESVSEAYRLGAVDYITRPFSTVVVQHRVKNTLLMYTNQKRLVHVIEKQVYEREKVNSSMINILSNVIELRNHESGKHTLNVQSITNMLLHSLRRMTNRYDLSNESISLISSLSALHDIGKIKVPEEVLNKPGKLTDEEWKLMKKHTVDGEELLKRAKLDEDSEFVRTARSICRWHHEKYDGSGYPDGLKGDQIPIAAQVVSMADVYDALTSERCYKKAFTHEKAVEMILNGECGAFNPLLLECLKDISDALKEFEVNEERYDYENEARAILDDILSENDIVQDGAVRQMLAGETEKKKFFMEYSEGIQFEYDKHLHKVTIVNTKEHDMAKRNLVFAYRDIENSFVPLEYWNALREKLLCTTRENCMMEMDVKLHVDDADRPFHAVMMTIWLEGDEAYTSVIGHFTQLPED